MLRRHHLVLSLAVVVPLAALGCVVTPASTTGTGGRSPTTGTPTGTGAGGYGGESTGPGGGGMGGGANCIALNGKKDPTQACGDISGQTCSDMSKASPFSACTQVWAIFDEGPFNHYFDCIKAIVDPCDQTALSTCGDALSNDTCDNPFADTTCQAASMQCAAGDLFPLDACKKDMAPMLDATITTFFGNPWDANGMLIPGAYDPSMENFPNCFNYYYVQGASVKLPNGDSNNCQNDYDYCMHSFIY